MQQPEPEPAIAPPEKTQEQLQEELRLKQEEDKAKEQERRRLQEEARVKTEQDLKKLEEALKGSLSAAKKTADNRSMAYCRLTLAEKELERLFPTLLRYQQVRYLDISSNTIADLSIVTQLAQLVHINASKNNVTSLHFFNAAVLDKLQHLNLSVNKIKLLTDIKLPQLRRLNLSENEISELSWNGHPRLEVLELRKNKLTKLKNLAHLKNVKEIYVCENELTDLRGIEEVPSLWKLSLRNNKIKKILTPFPFMPALTYLNLRENQLASILELKKLDLHVQTINFIANPLAEELGENTKKEVVLVLPHFVRVNKSDVSVEDRAAFLKEYLEKQAEREKERLEKEAADQEIRRAEQQAKKNEAEVSKPEQAAET